MSFFLTLLIILKVSIASLSLHSTRQTIASLKPENFHGVYALMSGGNSCSKDIRLHNHRTFSEHRIVIPHSSIKEDGHFCTGSGSLTFLPHPDDAIRRRNVIRLQVIETLMTHDVPFVVAVDDTRRVCGRHVTQAYTLTVFTRSNSSVFSIMDTLVVHQNVLYMLVYKFGLKRIPCVYVRIAPTGVLSSPSAIPTAIAPSLSNVNDNNNNANQSPNTDVVDMGNQDNDEESSELEEPSLAPSPFTDGQPACFPASSVVSVLNGTDFVKKRMTDLSVGDEVLCGTSCVSKVFASSHADDIAISTFITLHTAVRNCTLTLSPGHYIPVNGGILKPAQTVHKGDKVVCHGEDDVVQRLDFNTHRGLFNPHTISGWIVVDDVLVSTFTTAVHPVGANALLAPIKAFFAVVGNRVPFVLQHNLPSTVVNMAEDVFASVNFGTK